MEQIMKYNKYDTQSEKSITYQQEGQTTKSIQQGASERITKYI